MKEEKIRVRFAPSPTGHLHIGNARTAILNWLFARQTNGKFILRIEDTDLERSEEEFVHPILEDLKWLGLSWDEGPEVGGHFGPYQQSQRLDIYRDYANQLLEQGKSYLCYCSPEELESLRKEALSKGQTPKYNRRCLNLTLGQKIEFEAEGRKPAIRFNVPPGEIKFHDLVKGEVIFSGENIGDFVILRHDGIPTYNFAAVVDDHLMEISHVIRGDDHVSNTPRQILLYRALDWEPPKFAHIPMILGKDRLRLSKRHGATSVDQYRKKGYLPEALINFLSLLSWSSETGDEILSVDRLINEFNFNRVAKAPAVFNVEKLNWMNGYYIRNSDLDRITQLAIPYLQNAGFPTDNYELIKKAVSLVVDNLEYMSQVVEHLVIFFQDEVVINDPEAREWVRKETSQRIFWSFLRELKNIENLTPDIFRKIMHAVQKETGLMGRELWMPVRVALTGKTHGPELPLVADILQKEKCEQFIKKVVSSYKG